MSIHLNNREIAAVLAGLRLVQDGLCRGEFLPAGVHPIYDDEGTIEGLSEDEIDDLCESINESTAPMSDDNFIERALNLDDNSKLRDAMTHWHAGRFDEAVKVLEGGVV